MDNLHEIFFLRQRNTIGPFTTYFRSLYERFVLFYFTFGW